MKCKRFKKVVEWDYAIFNGDYTRDSNLLIMGIIFMIPIIGQIIWIIGLLVSLESRKVYYEEIK